MKSANCLSLSDLGLECVPLAPSHCSIWEEGESEAPDPFQDRFTSPLYLKRLEEPPVVCPLVTTRGQHVPHSPAPASFHHLQGPHLSW